MLNSSKFDANPMETCHPKWRRGFEEVADLAGGVERYLRAQAGVPDVRRKMSMENDEGWY